MPIAHCRECNAEVSDSAKVCPHCGVSKPIKKTSLIFKVVVGLIGFFVLTNAVILVGKTPSADSQSATAPQPPDPKVAALAAVKLEKWSWHKGGFDTVMQLNATIKDEGERDVKDIKIVCTHSSNSGTTIDQNQKVAYELVRAGKSVVLKDFGMGFMHTQATQTSCQITDLVVL